MPSLRFFLPLVFVAWSPLHSEEPGSLYQPNLDLERLIYRAEVFGQKQAVLSTLRGMLQDERRTAHRTIIRAIGVVNAGQDIDGDRKLEANAAETMLRGTTATVAFRGVKYALVGGRWRRLGDWVGPYLIAAIEPEHILAEHDSGYERRFNLVPKGRLEPANFQRYASFHGADLGDVLAFICDRERLNSYIPSGINTPVNGVYVITDWWTLLDEVSQHNQIQWTRHLDNLVFQPKDQQHEPSSQPLIGIYGKNKNLGALFQTIAENFGMELVLDEEFADVEVDIHNEEQPWNEVLDCLALMNGFQWWLTENRGHRRLVIQKER
ncbi:hypothetical protein [Acanthopleuribacter pedis]|uniref:Uncharacterized protein n=1 Tax=Acanthopleuribacter pedis TaxID=442870 RepID=A0A8J7QPE5_9BACT|nr:hypothetical protein [Acanthopleuribacter pedis]MBO1321685.1 hypothetical protein [Acanthopleuribacter pedis]